MTYYLNSSEAILKVEMLKGTIKGKKYYKAMGKDELNCLVSPEPRSYAKVIIIIPIITYNNSVL